MQHQAATLVESGIYRRRKRNITYYNPPFSRNVRTNIGRKFLELIDKNFPKGHPLHQICNRSTLKLSYSCMPNMASAIKGHNKSILTPPTDKPATCNCINKDECPLPGNCTIEGVVYEAAVETQTKTKRYVGLTCNRFQDQIWTA